MTDLREANHSLLVENERRGVGGFARRVPAQFESVDHRVIRVENVEEFLRPLLALRTLELLGVRLQIVGWTGIDKYELRLRFGEGGCRSDEIMHLPVTDG